MIKHIFNGVVQLHKILTKTVIGNGKHENDISLALIFCILELGFKFADDNEAMFRR